MWEVWCDVGCVMWEDVLQVSDNMHKNEMRPN